MIRTVRYAIVHGLNDEACHSGEIWLLWNMACNTAELRKKHLDDYVRGYGKFNPDADAKHLANVRKDLEKLIETKLKMFPNDLRQVVEAKIVSVDGGERIVAVAIGSQK